MSLIRLDEIPDLDDFVPASADLSSEYWTPENGEVRRMVFWAIEKRQAPDHDDPSKSVELESVVFIEPNETSYSTVVNGSKRLVAAFANNDVQQGTPVQVTYMGKKKNRTNQNMSDHWSVIELKPRGAKS